MICSFGAILAWKSDADDDADNDADYDDDHKSDPYMSPSYAGDTKTFLKLFPVFQKKIYSCTLHSLNN